MDDAGVRSPVVLLLLAITGHVFELRPINLQPNEIYRSSIQPDTKKSRLDGSSPLPWLAPIPYLSLPLLVGV